MDPIGVWLSKQSLGLNRDASSLEVAIELENRRTEVLEPMKEQK